MGITTVRARLGEAAHIQPRFLAPSFIGTRQEAPMTRLVISLGTLIALMAVVPAAEAGSYSFSIGGHRFHVEAPKSCRSASCVSISSNRGLRPSENADARPAAPLSPAP